MRNALLDRPHCQHSNCLGRYYPESEGRRCNRCGDRLPKEQNAVAKSVIADIPLPDPVTLPFVDEIPLPWDFEAPAALPWTLDDAVALCREIEQIAPKFGAHVALTGGTLYKDGSRKDVDILFYRIRQVKKIDRPRLLRALKDELGIAITKRHGWVQKAVYAGKPIDFFFPDHVDSERDETGEYA